MAGFTPINAPRLARLTVPASTSLTISEAAIEEVPSQKSRQSARKATGMTGNPDHHTNETALHGNGVRKAASKGNKRAWQTGSEPKSKRRKSNQITRALPTKKPGVSSTKAPNNNASLGASGHDLSSTDVEAASAASKAKLNAYRHNVPTNVTDSAYGDVSSQVRPVSVFAQPTTFDTVPSFQVQTTMQAVQQAANGGRTIYSKAASDPSVNHPTDIARPWLDVVSKKPPATANTRVLRPRNGKHAVKDLPKHPLQTPPTSDFIAWPTNFSSDDEALEAKSYQKSCNTRSTLRSESDEEFAVLDDADESELIGLAASVEESAEPRKTPPPRDRKQNMRDVHEHEDYGGALFSTSEKAVLERLKAAAPKVQPVVRKPFPVCVLDRSPLFGVSGTTTLRTCFRVGEALNTGCQAIRNNKIVILELYARVTASHREPKPSRKQHFVIKDMYHNNPPYLNGTFELWEQSALWELDSRPFLSASPEGVLCRIIARMKRDGTKWLLEILSIWQADWDDVEHVAGIYVKQSTDADD